MDKIKKYAYSDILSVELKEVTIKEDTKILFNESNETEWTHQLIQIQYILVVNYIDAITYYSDEKEQAIEDYKKLLSKYKEFKYVTNYNY